MSSDSVDIELWDAKGFHSVKNSRRVIVENEDNNSKRGKSAAVPVYEADVHGDIAALMQTIENETGKKVIIIDRKSKESTAA